MVLRASPSEGPVRQRLLLVVAAAAVACSVSACGTPSPQGSSSGTATSGLYASKAPAGTVAFEQRGRGSRTTRTFAASGRWRLTFSYDCSSLGHKGRFALTLRSRHGKKTVTVQKGFGGGGSRLYRAGSYALAVHTACQWSLEAKSV
jgi:hypothetical protein